MFHWKNFTITLNEEQNKYKKECKVNIKWIYKMNIMNVKFKYKFPNNENRNIHKEKTIFEKKKKKRKQIFIEEKEKVF